MKTVVFGAAGQLGTALLATAPPWTDVVGVTREQIDITDHDAVHDFVETAKPSIIINAAAYTAVDKAENDEASARLGNTIAPENLASAAQSFGARFVHFSTDFVFDGKKSTAYATDDAPAPINVYGSTKYNGEKAVIRTSPNALIIRTSWVYSTTGQNFVKTMIRLMRTKSELRVVADQIGSPTHAISLARGCWKLLGQNCEGIFHYTDSGVASWYDFAQAIKEEAISHYLIADKSHVIPETTDNYPRPAKRPAFSVLDKTKTVDAIGQIPHWRTELSQMVERLTEFDLE